jgi:hypothetical protein
MPIADQKKIQSFIQHILLHIKTIKNVNIDLQAARTAWLNHAPDITVPGSNLTPQNVIDIDAFINAINKILVDHSVIIAILEAKDIPSHGTKSLD